MATTEPVADYMLQAVAPTTYPVGVPGRHHERHRPLAAGRATEESLFTQHKVKVFLYNQQVTDSLTESLISLAHPSRIPVIGVYETSPPRVRLPVVDGCGGQRPLQGRDQSTVSTEHL